MNPALSAHAALEGCFNFKATPMAPPGTKAYVHVKPQRRKTWGFHEADAWYVGPAMKHVAITNDPVEAPPDYVKTVQRLRAVLIPKEITATHCTCAPSRTTPVMTPQASKMAPTPAAPATTPREPIRDNVRIPRVTQEEPEGGHSGNDCEPEDTDDLPALISQEEDSDSEDEDEEEPEQP